MLVVARGLSGVSSLRVPSDPAEFATTQAPAPPPSNRETTGRTPIIFIIQMRVRPKDSATVSPSARTSKRGTGLSELPSAVHRRAAVLAEGSIR